MNTKRIAIYIMLVVLVIGVHGFLKVVWVTLVAAIVAAAVAAWVTRKMSPAPPPSAANAPAPELPEWVGHLRSLVVLNLSLRENALPELVVAKLEHVIDRLRQLIPDLNENYSGSELTWTVNRMSTDYLNRVVTPYVALPGASREERADELLESLRGLEAELESIEGLVKNNQEGDFESKAAFLRARFLEDKV